MNNVRKTKSVVQKKSNRTEIDEGTRVAHALNLCMVSLSQIVDYADINVLRQEYDAILNNLNIENIIKHDALLAALKQILDTCHFYILHARDKEILKKKQAARLKGALGRAIGGGNVIAIFGSPNPWAIAASAATMIGITAVKYKSELDKARLENEIEEWELDKTALEQLHNLRRTLFETAWRLCEAYKFPEGQRLTERLIGTYNGILTDPDPVSRFERLSLLEAVHDFSAYPIFYYYKGRAALEAAMSSPEAKDAYNAYAEKAFRDFIGLRTVNNLLKEDVIAAGAYLDAASLMKSKSEILVCIEEARKIAGLNSEIIQNCAFRYLLLLDDKGTLEGELSAADESKAVEGAIWCLRFLVSEDYNGELNGRALSRLYKSRNDRKRYEVLKACVKSRHSFAYQWMEPWSEMGLQTEWQQYCCGAGMKRAIANYIDARTRLVMRDLSLSINADVENGNHECLKRLKGENWNQNVRYEDRNVLFERNDPKGAIDAMLWFKDNNFVSRKSVFNGVFALNAVGGTVQGAFIAVGLSAVGLGLIATLPGAVGAAYALYKNRLSEYGIVDPDSENKVPKVLKSCIEKLERDYRRRDEMLEDAKKAECEYLNAVAKVVERPDQLIDFEELEIRLREFVMRQAEAICGVIERVLPLDAEAVAYWQGKTTSQIVPECVCFSKSLEYQSDVMRILAIEQQIVRDHFVSPRYFDSVLPRGGKLAHLSPTVLFD